MFDLSLVPQENGQRRLMHCRVDTLEPDVYRWGWGHFSLRDRSRKGSESGGIELSRVARKNKK